MCRYTEDATSSGRALNFSWGAEHEQTQPEGTSCTPASADAMSNGAAAETEPAIGQVVPGDHAAEEGNVWLELQSTKYKLDSKALAPGCECSTCKQHTRCVPPQYSLAFVTCTQECRVSCFASFFV